MNTETDRRPLSPYLIGPYYKPQLTSMLSIFNRFTGVFMTAVSLPLVLWWMVALALGPEAFAMVQGFMSSLVGKALMLISLFFVCYHLANGIRHLVWDSGRFLELDNIYRTGWIMVASSIALFGLTLWAAS